MTKSIFLTSVGGLFLCGTIAAFLSSGALADDCKPVPSSEANRNIAPLVGAIGASAFSHRGYITPAEARSGDLKGLAEALVARLQRECEDTRPPQGRGEVMDSDIMMVVPSSALPFIAKHGFANQHLTNSSGGLVQTNARLRKEELLIGMQMPYTANTRDLLPKYAVLNIHRDDVGKFGVPDYYGDVSVVFKKQVGRRTTWTNRDSLVVNFESRPEEFPPRTTQYRYDASRPLKCQGYCEAQVWGPLGGEDVDHIMVKKGTELTPNLKALGVPVYEYEGIAAGDVTPENKAGYATSHQAAMFERGNLIYDGSEQPSVPVPQKLPEPVKNIMADRALATLPTEELKRQFATLPFKPITKENPIDGFSQRAKVFAEISSRGLAGKGEKFLRAALEDKDPLVRREALLGLSDLPKDRFRSVLLAKLSDQDRNVVFRAVAMAADHKDDPEIAAAAIKAIRMKNEGDARVARELWERLRQPTFCTSGAVRTSSN